MAGMKEKTVKDTSSAARGGKIVQQTSRWPDGNGVINREQAVKGREMKGGAGDLSRTISNGKVPQI